MYLNPETKLDYTIFALVLVWRVASVVYCSRRFLLIDRRGQWYLEQPLAHANQSVTNEFGFLAQRIPEKV
jgi:hypothetical protein